ncbi:MAG: hypothetical protein II816_08260 [Elusimicrobia bacterium]|nr:hypothetical protein [Elusimicrobiota bacterium]
MVNVLVFFYNCLMLIFLFPILLGIFLSGKKNRQEFLYKISERLSCWKVPELDKNKKTIWIHCASLGEARAVEPMIPHLQEYNIIVSAITKSAREYISKIKGISYYALMPVDLYPFIAKQLKKVKPDILVLIETEFWPSMIICANKIGTKIITVNGRISKNAFPYYKLTKFFWKPFLNLISFISVRNEQDYERFKAMIEDKNKLEITGNIKYDRDWTHETMEKESLFFTEQDRIFTAGSTREGEEKKIINVYKEVIKKYKNLKLIIAPRHISRVKDVISLLEKNNLKFVLFSQLSSGTEKDVVVVDVFGKLQAIYSISDMVFVGGSLVNKGGQNPIEAAAYAKPVIYGKHMFNFESEVKALTSNGGVEIEDETELKDIIEKFMYDEPFRIQLGAKAARVVEQQKGAVAKNIKIIKNV